MHSGRRARLTADQLEARRQKDQAKLQEYLKLTDEVLGRKKAKDWSEDALNLTTRILHINPEFYTIWNYRRDIFTNGIFPVCTPSDINDILGTDLSLTMTFLRMHPKVYWIWNHRRWCLENVPDCPEGDPQEWKKINWTMELKAVEKMLGVDARNFLAWDYRRYVLRSMPVKRPDSDELAFTTQKIEANFSNFSAWHQRSKVYSVMWEKGLLDEAKTKDVEFELVKQALYVDPYDQSAWIYHRWLVGGGDDQTILTREISVISELLEIEPDCKWCLESLVHYKQLILKKHATQLTETEAERLPHECQSILDKLKEVDPYRMRRYEDISTQLRLPK